MASADRPPGGADGEQDGRLELERLDLERLEAPDARAVGRRPGAARQCSFCGHHMPGGSQVCLLCGRDVPTEAVEPEPAGERPSSPSAERVVADARGGRPRRQGIVAIAATVVVLLALVWLFAGGDNGGDDEASTGPTTTTEVAPSSRPTTTRAPAARPPATRSGWTTTTVAPPTTLHSQILSPHAPLLGEETGGLSLYVASGNTVLRVELDTGEVTTATNAFRGGGFTLGVAVEDGSVYVARDNGVYAFPGDLSTVPRMPVQSQVCCPSPNQLLTYMHRGDHWVVSEMTLSGETKRQWTLTTTTQWEPVSTAAIGDELLVARAGRLYLVSTDGSIRHYAIGEYVASRGEWILWRSCDERMRCGLHLGNPDNPHVHDLALGDDSIVHTPWGMPPLAPNGRSIVVGGSAGKTRLVDTSTGDEIAEFASGAAVAWTPDGAWAFGRPDIGTGPHRRVVAVSTRDDRRVEFELPFTFDRGDVFAVG